MARPLRIMGVLNVTPDSFSDGGEWFSFDDAVAHGRELAAQGAAILDVGGESTRPGAAPVPEDEELRRVIGSSRRSAAAAQLSIDTSKLGVARGGARRGRDVRQRRDRVPRRPRDGGARGRRAAASAA